LETPCRSTIQPATVDAARKVQPAHFRGTPPSKALLEKVREDRWSEMTSHLLSNVTGQASPVLDAQGEIVCVMTTVADLGQLRTDEERRALFHEACIVNESTGGLIVDTKLEMPKS
jgi:DNA-binding IclR family transcriptional regulator